MTERQLINAIKKAISENGIEYDASDLKNNLREDPDAIYDVMIGFSRSHDKDAFLALAEAVVDYERAMPA